MQKLRLQNMQAAEKTRILWKNSVDNDSPF